MKTFDKKIFILVSLFCAALLFSCGNGGEKTISYLFNYADGRTKTVNIPESKSVEDYFPTDHSEEEYHFSERYKIVYNNWEKADTTTYNEVGDDVNIYKVTYKSNPDGASHENPEWLEVNKPYALKDASLNYYTFAGWFTQETGGTGITVLNQSEDITIWSRFAATKYFIEYNLNGGAMDITDKDKEYTVEDAVTLKEPTKNGYNFIAWYDNPSLTGSPISGWQPGDKNGTVKLYAKYSDPIPYTITYTNVSSTEHSNPLTYNVTQSFLLNKASRNGYNFTAWHKDNKDGETITKIDKGTYGNLTLYGEWSSPIEYTINYIMPEGATHENKTKYTIEDETFNLSDAKKKGYSFDGWHKGSTTGEKIESISKGSYGNLNLYTTATAIKYDIEYNLNGGSLDISEDDKKYTIEDTVNLDDIIPNKNGYEFKGWYEKSDFSGSAITGWEPGDKTDKVTLYAKWSDPIEYTITYVNVESSEHSNPDSYDVTDEIELDDPSRDDWNFYGWYTEATFENEVESIPKGTTGNITLYAKMILDKTLEEASWDEIALASKTGTARDSFGDPGTQTKKVQLKHQDLDSDGVIDDNEICQTVRIIDYNHDINPSGDALGITFEFADLISDANGNSLATFWHDRYVQGIDYDRYNNYLRSTLRANLVGKSENNDTTDISWYTVGNATKEGEGSAFYNKTVLDMFPNELSKNLATTRKKIDYKEYNSTFKETDCDDKLFVLSPREMNIEWTDSEPDSNTVYAYYDDVETAADRRIKKQVNSSEQRTTTTRITDAKQRTSIQTNYAGQNRENDSSYYYLRTPKKYYDSVSYYEYVYSITPFPSSWSCNSFMGNCDAFPIAPAFCI